MIKKLFLLLILLLILIPMQLKPACINAWAASSGTNNPVVCYTVQPGDTLSEIAHMFQLPVSKLIGANGLKDSTIRPDQILIIPDSSDSTTISRGNQLRDDIILLAKAIHAEARGESFTGQVAVGAVIMNRVASPKFPNTIEEVIMQRTKYSFQFSPVADGSIHLPPDESAFKAAFEALRGVDPTGGALFFYNPEISSDKWITTLPVVTKIGNHVFATKA